MAKKSAKLEKEMVSRLSRINVNATDEQTAKEGVLEILEENGIEGMDDESLETLIEIAESFVEVDETASTDEKEEEEAEEEETEEEAEEEEAEEEEEETEEEADEEEEEEEEPVKPVKTAKKAAAKVETKKAAPAAKKAEKAASKTEKKPAKKEAAKVETKKAAKKAETKSAKVKLDPKNNEKDRKYFDVFNDLMPEKEYERAWTVAGVTFKHIGKNGKSAVVSVEQCKLIGEDIKCVIFMNKKMIEPLEANDIEFGSAWNGSPMIKDITFDEVLEILDKVIETAEANAKKQDKKLGDNRKKMEAEMKAKKSAKAAETDTAKKPAKKAKK